MATRTYTQKDGTIWEWEESKELLKILKEIHSKKENEPK
jgi:hypothetical protein